MNLVVQNAGAAVTAVTGVNQVNQINFASAGASAADNAIQLTFGSTQVTLGIASEAAQYNIASLVETTIDSLAGEDIATVGTGAGTAFTASTASATGAHKVQISDNSAFGAALAVNVKGVAGITNALISSYVAPVTASAALEIPGTVTTNTQIINISNTTGQTVKADASNWGGETQIWNTSPVTGSLVEISKATLGTTFGTAGKSGVTATYADSLSTAPVTNGTVNIAASGAGASDASVTMTVTAGANQAFKTLGVAAVAGTSFITIAGTAAQNAVETLNVTGAGKITIVGTDANTFANVRTVNASTNTGGTSINLGDNAQVVTYTGGSGDDKVSFNASGLTSADKLDGGAGVNTIAVATTEISSVATGGTGAEQGRAVNASTNFQKLEMTGSTATLTASVITSLNNFVFSGTGTTGAVSVSGVTAARTFEVTNSRTGASATDALNFRTSVDGAADVLNLTVKGTFTGGDNGSGTGGDGLDASQIETLNLTVTGNTSFVAGSSSSGAASSLVIGDNATINITGGAYTVGLGTVNGVNTTINASGLAGGLTVVGDSGNNVITGGAGANTITGGDGRDTINITLSIGERDTLTLKSWDSSSTVTAAARDVITGFTVGTGSSNDQIKVANYAASTDYLLVTDRSLAYSIAGPNSGSTGDVVIEFSIEGDAVVNLNDGSANSLNGTNLLKALGTGGVSSTITLTGTGFTTADVGYLVAYQGGRAFVYANDTGSSTGTDTIIATELALVGTFDAVTLGGFTSTNFVA